MNNPAGTGFMRNRKIPLPINQIEYLISGSVSTEYEYWFWYPVRTGFYTDKAKLLNKENNEQIWNNFWANLKEFTYLRDTLVNIHANWYLNKVINGLSPGNLTYPVLINPNLDYPVPFDTYTNLDLQIRFRFIPTRILIFKFRFIL